MPSTVVHLALAGLVAAGLLGEAFSRRSLAVVFGAVVFADLDVFVGLVVTGGHRAVFHSLLWPMAAGVLLVADTRLAARSRLRESWGPQAVRVAWVAILAFVLAALGLDLVTGGANPLYPLHDQFYRVQGTFLISSQEGIVQTFVEIGSNGGGPKQLGSTAEVHVGSGVDPTAGETEPDTERIFPIAQRGWQLLVILTSVVVVGGRLREEA